MDRTQQLRRASPGFNGWRRTAGLVATGLVLALGCTRSNDPPPAAARRTPDTAYSEHVAPESPRVSEADPDRPESPASFEALSEPQRETPLPPGWAKVLEEDESLQADVTPRSSEFERDFAPLPAGIVRPRPKGNYTIMLVVFLAPLALVIPAAWIWHLARTVRTGLAERRDLRPMPRAR